jgi:hypothetical protein
MKTKIEHVDIDLKDTHKFSRNNEKLIKKSKKVGCFYCLKIYPAKEVKGYRSYYGNGAICSYCTVDSLLPDCCGFELSEKLLKAMRSKWFNL